MTSNVEVKARVPDLDGIRARAASLSSGPSQVLEQSDTFFDVSRGRLKVREFPDGSGELISYERPDLQGPKVSAYSRFACADARGLSETLGRVLAVRGIVSKRREVFLIGRTRVHLDQVEKLGSFVELEVVVGDGELVEHADREARELLVALGLSSATLIAGAYVDLLEQGSR